VEIGSTVTVETEQHKKQNYIVVGSAEASPLEGKISNESPVGQALFGHKVGDVVQVKTPSKVIKLKITKMK
jgi:transcription elongation factor GreA